MSETHLQVYLDCIAKLAKADQEFASSPVPVGISQYWGRSLHWPAWMLEGTEFPAAQSLPSQIALSDDLRILANLLDRMGEDTLLGMVLSWPRYPGEFSALAAPNLKAAITWLSRSFDIANAPIQIRVITQAKASIIAISLHPSLGPFRSLFEGVLLLIYYLIARSFVGLDMTGAMDMSEVIVEPLHSGLVARHLPCSVFKGSNHARIHFPSRLLFSKNPEFRSEIWTLLSGLESHEGASQLPSRSFGKQAIQEAVKRSLIDRGKALSASELAESCGVSERTLARTLQKSETSYRSVLTTERMNLAKDLLRHGGLQISEIASLLGYSEASTFVRAFNKQFKVPPGKWRMLGPHKL